VNLHNRRIIVSAEREPIAVGDLVYWDCTDLAGLDYEPNVLIHDSDGCEYSQKTINVATGVVLTRVSIPGATHIFRWGYDVLCSDGIIRRIAGCSLWIARK